MRIAWGLTLFVLGCLASSPAYAADEKVEVRLPTGQLVKVSADALKEAFARYVRRSRQYEESVEFEVLGIPVCYLVTDEGDKR